MDLLLKRIDAECVFITLFFCWHSRGIYLTLILGELFVHLQHHGLPMQISLNGAEVVLLKQNDCIDPHLKSYSEAEMWFAELFCLSASGF